MKKKIYPIFAIALVTLLTALVLGGCSVFAPAQMQPVTETPVVEANAGTSVVVEGHIAPRDDASLTFATAGEVAEVLVIQGQTVAQGDVLARLGNRETYQAQVTAAALELAAAQQQVDDLNENTSLAYSQALLDLTTAQRRLTDAQEALETLDTEAYQDQIDNARTRVTDAKDALDDAQDEFDKYQDLANDHPNRTRAEDALDAAQDRYNAAVRELDRLRYDLDQAQAEVEMAQAQLDAALRNRDERQDGPDPDEMNLAQTRLENAQAQLAAAQAALDDLELTAPFSGTIVDVDVTPGERVGPARVVIVLVDFSEWYVETNDLTEHEVVLIELGREAVIVPDALPDVELTGKVVSINDAYTERAGDVIYTTRLLLNETDPRLRWGMTVEVRFADN